MLTIRDFPFNLLEFVLEWTILFKHALSQLMDLHGVRQQYKSSTRMEKLSVILSINH